jgi:hypothetical protein
LQNINGWVSRVALATALTAGAVSFASRANASTFDFVDTTDGVNAVVTLNVVSGEALSGTGTLTSPFWTGTDTITLVTPTTPSVNNLGGSSGDCSPMASTCLSYRFGGGTDLIGDTVFPPDSNGLVFLVANPSDPALDLGFNVWSDGSGNYTGFLAGNSVTPTSGIIYAEYNGTGSFTVTQGSLATPLPSTWVMLFAGLVGLGFFAFRGTKTGTAALAAA